MKISKEDLKSFTPIANKVLLRSVVKMDSVKAGDKKLYVDTTFKPEWHQEVICEVIATPRYLVFDRNKPVGESMEWQTTVQVKPGDIVWARALMVQKGKEDFLIECDGINYFLLDYADLYLKKDKTDVVMLNGWVLLEPIYVEPKEIVVDGKVIYLENVAKPDEGFGVARQTQFGRIKHLGKPIINYYYADTTFDDDFCRVGDIIMFTTSHNVRLEHELHRHFSGEDLIVSRRSRFLGIVEF